MKIIKIGVTQGMAGWFAVVYEYTNPYVPDVIATGVGRYDTKEEAMIEAEQWAAEERLPVDFK